MWLRACLAGNSRVFPAYSKQHHPERSIMWPIFALNSNSSLLPTSFSLDFHLCRTLLADITTHMHGAGTAETPRTMCTTSYEERRVQLSQPRGGGGLTGRSQLQGSFTIEDWVPTVSLSIWHYSSVASSLSSLGAGFFGISSSGLPMMFIALRRATRIFMCGT